MDAGVLGDDTWGALNVHTRRYAENERSGLMVCGINWGGKEDEPAGGASQARSFFSDRAANDWPFPNVLGKWFDVWGHPLQSVRGNEGAFEKSILQTNWIPGQSSSTSNFGIESSAKESIDSFVEILAETRPAMILLCSRALGNALQDHSCLGKVEAVLGKASQLSFIERPCIPKPGGGLYRRFHLATQTFGYTDLIVLPHPSGSRGIHVDYMAGFRQKMEPILDRYKSKLA